MHFLEPITLDIMQEAPSASWGRAIYIGKAQGLIFWVIVHGTSSTESGRTRHRLATAFAPGADFDENVTDAGPAKMSGGCCG